MDVVLKGEQQRQFHSMACSLTRNPCLHLQFLIESIVKIKWASSLWFSLKVCRVFMECCPFFFFFFGTHEIDVIPVSQMLRGVCIMKHVHKMVYKIKTRDQMPKNNESL